MLAGEHESVGRLGVGQGKGEGEGEGEGNDGVPLRVKVVRHFKEVKRR